MSKSKISLVIPAYNESRRITQSLIELQSFVKSAELPFEVLIVIEKSTDNTVEVAKNLIGSNPTFRIIANDVQKGKGYAVKTGMLQATGDIVIFMDVDLSTPLTEVKNFIDYFQQHPQTDVLIGSRQHAKSQILKKQNPLRQKMGQIYNIFVQVFAVKGITDTQCGFKAFRQNCVQPVFSKQSIDGFSFDVEILLLAQYLNYKIDVLPVQWINDPHSKVRIVRDSFKMLIDLLRTKRRVKKNLKVS